MKARMSIMKSGEQTQTVKAGGETTPVQGANLNSSFSMMNSSLSAKWMSKKAQIGKEPAQMAATMVPNLGQQLGTQTQALPMNQSLGEPASQIQHPQSAPGTAQGTELNRRLAEMKAKLQALQSRKNQ